MSNEEFWKRVKFVLLFTFASSILFILLTKFLFQIPSVQSRELLDLITRSEDILKQQEVHVEKAQKLQNAIDSLDFDIHQVQRLDEIEREIFGLEDIYRQNNGNSKYFFGVQASRILKIYFDSKEELSSTMRNNHIIEQNLEECKANI